MASRPMMPPDPDAGIPDLIRRLADDSKRLAGDEVRLAKLELRENLHQGAKGGVRLALAFGLGVVALVALTICLSALLGRLFGGNYWAGTLAVAVLELGAAAFLIKNGLAKMARPSLTLPESRAALRETAQWVQTVREPELTVGDRGVTPGALPPRRDVERAD